MATRKTRAARTAAPEPQGEADADAVQVVKHRARRKNIPPAGLEAQSRVEQVTKVRLDYNPHRPPRLRFADDPATTDRLPELLRAARERALSDGLLRRLRGAVPRRRAIRRARSASSCSA